MRLAADAFGVIGDSPWPTATAGRVAPRQSFFDSRPAYLLYLLPNIRACDCLIIARYSFLWILLRQMLLGNALWRCIIPADETVAGIVRSSFFYPLPKKSKLSRPPPEDSLWDPCREESPPI